MPHISLTRTSRVNNIQHHDCPHADQVQDDHDQSRDQSSPVPRDPELSGKGDIDVGGDIELR